MKSIRDVLGLKHKKSLRLGLLLLSTLFIVSTSALAYASMVYTKALDVGNTSGVTTGSGSTALAESFTPATIMMLAVAAVVISLGMFGFLREASKHIGNAPGGRGSMQGEDWEESPRKEEGEK